MSPRAGYKYCTIDASGTLSLTSEVELPLTLSGEPNFKA
jgi:hypothetical protein